MKNPFDPPVTERRTGRTYRQIAKAVALAKAGERVRFVCASHSHVGFVMATMLERFDGVVHIPGRQIRFESGGVVVFDTKLEPYGFHGRSIYDHYVKELSQCSAWESLMRMPEGWRCEVIQKFDRKADE